MIHAAVGAMKDIKRRADFEVYLKKFLQSLNLILPNAAGHPTAVPARRFGYLLRMVKERYKDDSLDIADAGEKVKALINEHLIDLGINPKIPPVELLSDDFIAHVQQALAGQRRRPRRARWSTPSASTAPSTSTKTRPSTSKLSEKLEKLIQQHQDNWEVAGRGIRAAPQGGHRGADRGGRGADQGGDDLLRLRACSSPTTAARCRLTTARR